jgi:plastocyanin
MDFKKEIYLSVAAAILVLFIIFLFIKPSDFKKLKEPINDSFSYATKPLDDQNKENNLQDKENTLPTVPGGTRKEIDENVQVPNVDSDTPKEVAKPKSVISSDTGSALRTFEIKAERGKFVPEMIIVNEGDVVSITLESLDGDYNITLPDFGITIISKKGEVKRGQFTATPYGKYKFFCDKNISASCLPQTSGSLIVNKK